MYSIKQPIKDAIALFLIVGMCFLLYFSKKDREVKTDFIVNNTMYNRVCIDNKEFIQSETQLSINLDFEGKPIKCEEN